MVPPGREVECQAELGAEAEGSQQGPRCLQGAEQQEGLWSLGSFQGEAGTRSRRAKWMGQGKEGQGPQVPPTLLGPGARLMDGHL